MRPKRRVQSYKESGRFYKERWKGAVYKEEQGVVIQRMNDREGSDADRNGSDDEQAVMVHSSQIDQVRRRAWGVRHMQDVPNGVWIEGREVEGSLGEAVTGDARDTATRDPMGDDSRIRDGGDGIACGHGSSMFGAEHQGMGFDFVVVFSSSFSFGEGLMLGRDMEKADTCVQNKTRRAVVHASSHIVNEVTRVNVEGEVAEMGVLNVEHEQDTSTGGGKRHHVVADDEKGWKNEQSSDFVRVTVMEWGR
ncbi:hypothetical protein EDB19DRAFT_1833861 [Suillus lakei]|nr:hypothetical protein EDB19DRAFT_1833861 [Suillus lakei]